MERYYSRENPEQDGSSSGSSRGGGYPRHRAIERSKSQVPDEETNLSSRSLRRLASDMPTNDAYEHRDYYKSNFNINNKRQAEEFLKRIRDYSERGEYDQAEARLEGFNQVLKERLGQYHHPYEEGVYREFAHLYTAWGKSELDKRNFGEAENKFKLAEKELKKRLDILRDQALSKRDGGCDLADAKGRLGVLYAYWGILEQEQDKPEQAKEKFEQAKPHLKYAVDNRADNKRCADRGAKKADKLGLVYTMLNEPHEAKKMHEMARKIRREDPKLGEPDLARADHNLGLDYADLGKLDLARRFFQRASDSYKEAPNLENPKAREDCRHDLKRVLEAGFAKLENDLGADNYKTKLWLYHQLKFYVDQGDLEHTTQVLEDAFTRRENRLGAEHRETKHVEKLLHLSLKAQDDPEHAAQLLKDALKPLMGPEISTEVKRSMINRLALEVPNKPELASEDLKVLKDLTNRYFLEVRSNSEYAAELLRKPLEMKPSKRTIPVETPPSASQEHVLRQERPTTDLIDHQEQTASPSEMTTPISQNHKRSLKSCLSHIVRALNCLSSPSEGWN